MKQTLRIAALGGIVVLTSLWTLAAVGAWWLLQAGASALEAQPTAVSLQAVMAWTERPWVRYWLDPHEADAFRDVVTWLLSLGGGPAVWLGSALTLLGVALVLVWAGGLLLGAVGLWAAWLVMRQASAWWRSGARGPWAMRQGTPAGGEAGPAT
ncbi:MAG: hypothetical protein MUF08_09700 [Burkholderiaceae bacterium]|jgi:hypothetical protein|nr:hypothetical protein [Burkholderiaceae bacterium]